MATAVLPAAGLVLAAGLLLGALAVPAVSGYLGARAGRRQATARGRLSAELVELIGAGPEVVAFGGEPAGLARVRAADAGLVGLARRDALATGVGRRPRPRGDRRHGRRRARWSRSARRTTAGSTAC